MPHKKPNVIRILTKRAYEEASPEDGYRVLVDRLWPRGRAKAELALGEWARELAPSTELRSWFGHDPARWEDFRRRYRLELQAAPQQAKLCELLANAGEQPITLVYGAKDEQHNQAVVLRETLLELIGMDGR